jgi:hypothetical protein
MNVEMVRTLNSSEISTAGDDPDLLLKRRQPLALATAEQASPLSNIHPVPNPLVTLTLTSYSQ